MSDMDVLIDPPDWMLIGVGADSFCQHPHHNHSGDHTHEPDPNFIQFTYTVGLAKYGGYEYMITALHPRDAGFFLNILGIRIRDENLVINAGDEVLADLTAGGWPFRVVDMDEDNEAFKAGEDRKVRQLLFCDRSGKYPGEDGADENIARSQRVAGSTWEKE